LGEVERIPPLYIRKLGHKTVKSLSRLPPMYFRFLSVFFQPVVMMGLKRGVKNIHPWRRNADKVSTLASFFLLFGGRELAAA